jgi:hypothetical protein
MVTSNCLLLPLSGMHHFDIAICRDLEPCWVPDSTNDRASIVPMLAMMTWWSDRVHRSGLMQAANVMGHVEVKSER